MTQYAVEVDAVTVRFGAHTALENISFTLAPATFLALIGPNAGGKSTLLRTILGLVHPTSGSVRVLGAPPAQRHANVGYVAQASQINTRYPATTRHVVAMGARLPAGNSANAVRERVDAILVRVGLSDVADANFHTLSGGQKQRAIIARALVPQPRLLLLDEPTGGIDTTGITQVLELLGDLRKDPQLSIIMVSHHIGDLMPYVDRVACLNRTLHWHDKTQLLSEEVLRKVYACELDAYFLKHHEHQAAYHTADTPHGHTHEPAADAPPPADSHG